MIRPTDLKIDAASSIGKELILVDVVPVREWRDGVRTDKVVAHKYVVAVKTQGFRKLAVKIEGEKILDTTDDLPEVTFDGLEVSLYWASGGIQVSAKAKGIELKNRTKGTIEKAIL